MLHIHNTLTNTKERFETAQPNVVRMYSCGLTVYGPMHVGHARTYCFWDMVRRYFDYSGYHVVSVINYTDIDDRIMRSADESRGTIDIAEEFIARFRRDCRALRVRDYSVYTRATDFVQEQIDHIAKLLELGHAYIVDGEVFYDVQSFPDYGCLSGNKLEEQRTGASGRVGEDASRKRHPADFTLWKPSNAGEPSWETGHAAWPSGRPGWHIECSAMSTSLLGSHFDIHGGAIDNLFPHHENEIAQSTPVCGHPWVRYWMHPEHLDLGGVKMSKSLGNVIGVPDLLELVRYDQLRWFFSTHHYRIKLAYREDTLHASSEGFLRITRLLDILEERLSAVSAEERAIRVGGIYASQRETPVPRMRHQYVSGAFGAHTSAFIAAFTEAMDDDFNSPRAATAIFDYVSALYSAGIDKSEDWPSVLAAYQALTRHLWVLGIERPHAELHPALTADCFELGGGDGDAPASQVLDKLVQLRTEARKARDFAKSDAIRDLLAEAGVVLEDGPKGTRWLLRD